MAYEIEEQTTGTDGTYFHTTRIRQGQKLTISNRTVTKLAFTLRRLGTISGDISFSIRAVDDDAVLATKVLGDASTISTSATQYEVTFTTPAYANEEVRITCDWPTATYNGSHYLQQTDEHSQVKADEGWCMYQDAAWVDTSYDIWDATYKYTYFTGSSEIAGPIKIVQDRFHYVDKYGVERYIKGTAVP